MATVYKVEIVSHWLNYHPKDLKKILEDALYSEDMNEVSIKVDGMEEQVPITDVVNAKKITEFFIEGKTSISEDEIDKYSYDLEEINDLAQELFNFLKSNGKAIKYARCSTQLPTEDEILSESNSRQLEGAEPYSFAGGARWALSNIKFLD
jgi:hypothetical protein